MTIFEKYDKGCQDKKQAEIKECMQVILILEKLSSNIYKLTATRQDKIIHEVVYSPWIFYTRTLYKSKRQLINEIELLSNMQVYVVTKFIDFE